jgi:hypothetical protein
VPTLLRTGLTGVPPTAVVYHNIVVPAGGGVAVVAVSVCIGLFSQSIISGPFTGAGGFVLIFNVTGVLVRLKQLVILFLASA